MIGIDKPSEATVWRMVAVMAHCLDVGFTRETALNHKGTIRTTINEHSKNRPRDVVLPRIVQYGAVEEIDAAVRAFARGPSLPEPLDINGAAAHHAR